MTAPGFVNEAMGVDPVYSEINGRKMVLGYRVVRWSLVPGKAVGTRVFLVKPVSTIYSKASDADRAFVYITGKSVA